MASNLPTFNETAQLQPGPLVSGAPVAQAADKAFSTLAGQVYKQSMSDALDQEKVKGQKAGLNPNFVPAEGIGPLNEAFNNAALAQNKLMINHDLTTKSNELMQEAAQNPDAAAGLQQYQTTYQAYTKTYLNGVPDDNKDSGTEFAKFQMGNASLALQKRVNKQNMALSTIQSQQQSQTLLTSMNASLAKDQPLAAKQQYNAYVQNVDHQFAIGQISAKEHKGSIKSAQSAFTTQKILSDYQQHLTQGTGPQYLEQATKGIGTEFKDVPIATRIGIVNKMKSLNSQWNQGLQINKAVTSKNFNTMISATKRGGKIDQTVLAQMIEAHPDQEALINGQVNDAQIVRDVSKSAMSQPIGSRQAYIDNQTAPNPKATGIKFDRQLLVNQELHSMVATLTKQRIERPVEFNSSHPAMQSAIEQSQIQKQTGVAAGNATTPLSPTHNPVVDPDDTQIHLQSLDGVLPADAKLMGKEQAKQSASILLSATPTDKWKYLQQLRADHPNHMSNVIKQLGDEGVPQSEFWLSSISPTDPMFDAATSAFSSGYGDIKKTLTDDEGKQIKQAIQAQILAPAQSAIAAGEPKTPTFWEKYGPIQFGAERPSVTNNNTANMMASVSNYATTAQSRGKYMNSYANYVNRLTTVLVSQGVPVDEAVNRSENTITQNFNFNNLGNTIVRYPKDQNFTVIETYAKELRQKRLAAFPFTVPPSSSTLPAGTDVNKPSEDFLTHVESFITDPTGAHSTLDKSLFGAINSGKLKDTPRMIYYRQHIATGHWANQDDNQGLMWVTNTGVPVTDANGRKFNMTWQQAVNNEPPDMGTEKWYAAKALKTGKQLGREFIFPGTADPAERVLAATGSAIKSGIEGLTDGSRK